MDYSCRGMLVRLHVIVTVIMSPWLFIVYMDGVV